MIVGVEMRKVANKVKKLEEIVIHVENVGTRKKISGNKKVTHKEDLQIGKACSMRPTTH